MKKSLIKLSVFLIAFLIFNAFSSGKAFAACTSVPISGNYTVSASCAFANTVDGVDAGSGTSNTAVLTINANQTLTVNNGQTIGYGSITNNGTITLNSTAVMQKGPIYMTDADSDGYPASTTQNTSSGRRRNLMNSISAIDCNEADATSWQNLSGYVDADGDGYPVNDTLDTTVCSGATLHSGYIASTPADVGCGGICTSPAPTTTSQVQVPITADWGNGSGVQIGTSAYLYTLGGYNNASAWYSAVYVGKVTGNNVTAQTSTTALPAAWLEHTSSSLVIGNSGYIYLLGGRISTSTTGLTSTYRATVNYTSGALSAWSAQTALPAGIKDATSTIVNLGGGSYYIYYIGGNNSGSTATVSTVYKAQISSAGAIGAWSQTLAYPIAAAYLNAANATINGTHYIYVYGDGGGTKLYKGLVGAGGAISSWTLESGSSVNSVNSVGLDTYSFYGTTYIYKIGGDWGGHVTYNTQAALNTSGDYGAGGFTSTGVGQLPVTLARTNDLIYTSGSSVYMFAWGGGTGVVKMQLQGATHIDCNDANASIKPGAGC